MQPIFGWLVRHFHYGSHEVMKLKDDFCSDIYLVLVVDDCFGLEECFIVMILGCWIDVLVLEVQFWHFWENVTWHWK